MGPPTAFRGGGRGGRGRGRFGGRGGRGMRDEGPPDAVVEIGKVLHECENEVVCKLTHETGMIPYFNAGIFLENKKKLGKVDEIFGPLQNVMFTVKPDPGVIAKTFKMNDIFYVDTQKLLPLSRFTNIGGAKKGGGRGGGRGGRGGRGGGRGGRGGRGGGRFGGRMGGRSPGRGRFGGRGGRGGRY